MDYDDNGFQSRNFQLVGDNNNKFPSSLRSFPLPKLDIDENFEANLRFDSLVGTDSLLGIQGQVNDWIDNFSSGNNALEFTSTATESCSISRYVNVWSEATSSESVEMLLKSVGEDEVKNGTNMEGVDAHNQQIGLKDQHNSYPQMEDMVNIGASPPPDSCANSSLGTNDNSVSVQNQLDGASQISKGEKSGMDIDAGPLVVRSQSVQETGAEVCTIDRKKTASSQDASKICPVLGGDFFEQSQEQYPTDNRASEKIEHTNHVCVAKVSQETSDHDTFIAQANPSAASVSGFLAVDKSRHQMVSHDEMEKHSDMITNEKEALTNDDSLKNEYGSAKVNTQFSEGHIIDSALCSMKSSYLGENMDSSVLLTEGCGGPLFSGNPDGLLEAIAYPVKVWNKVSVTGDKTPTTTVGVSYLDVEGNGNDVKHSIEINHQEDVNCHDLPGNSPKDGLCRESSLHAEDTKLIDKPEDEEKLDSGNNNKVNTTMEPGTPHSPNKQAHKIDGTDTKGGDNSSKTNLFGAVSSRHASSDMEKCAEDGGTEKEVIIDLQETVINVADADILSSDNHSQLGGFDKSVSDFTQHDGSLPSHMGPSGSPGSRNSDSDAFKVLDKTKPMTYPLPDSTLVKVVDDSLVKDMAPNESDLVASTAAELPLPASSEDKDVKISSSVHTLILKSDSEGQILSKMVSDSDHMDGLPGKEIVHGLTVGSSTSVVAKPALTGKAINDHQSHFEDNLAIGVALDPKQMASSVSASNVIQFDEKSETCSLILKTDANTQISITSTAVHDSGQSSPVRCKNKEDSTANVASGDGSYDQNFTHQSSNTQQHSQEAIAGKLGSSESNCGSPPVISCIEPNKDMMEQQSNQRLSDRKDTVEVYQPWICSETVLGCADRIQLTPHDSKESIASDDDKSFTFEVGPVEVLSEKSPGLFCAMQSFKLPQLPKDNLRESQFETEELHGPSTKTTNEDNTSACCSGQPTTSGGIPTEETPPSQPTEAKEKQCSISPSPVGTISKDMQSEEIRQYPSIEGNSIKASCSASVQASDLPDLNSSISAAALSHQPFTDLQQVQLRAQIFVYGSLIQGTPPDEACMVSAFGESDGGRSYWESLWHIALERFQNQKPPLSACETPVHSRSGVKIPELTRCNTLQSRALSPAGCQSGTNISPLVGYNSSSFPTPLWNISPRGSLHTNMHRSTNLDFNQALSPMHSYQPVQMRQYTGNSASWFSSSANPGSLIVPSQGSRSDATPQYSVVPVTGPQVTPSRELPVSCASNVQLSTSGVLLPSPGSSNVSVAPVAQIEAPRKPGTSGSNKKPSTGQKPRKRKKAAASEDLGPVFSVSQPQIEAPVTVGSENMMLSAALLSSGNSPTNVGADRLVTSTSQILSPTHYQIVSSGTTEQRVIFSEETCSKIEQAKLQAEDAAALAVSAIQHSQDIWSQIALKKDSGLASEVEEKLVSAAVAAAAASAVAKASAAAAKVASDAALQARIMADEAMGSVKRGNFAKSSETGHDKERNVSRLTPMSILKGKENSQGSISAIALAREASKRRLEAATAATKQAENLDAIVKAAELAAEAVSQAGIIVAMGDPLPFTLRELAEAGPENYWRVHCSTAERNNKTIPQNGTQELGTNVSGAQDITEKEFNHWPSNHNETQKISDGDGRSAQDECLVLPEKKYAGSGLGKTCSGEPGVSYERNNSASDLMEDIIRKDSVVEVVTDEDGLRGVWFSARVLDLKDDKAYVCYDNLLTDEGSDHLKEWIPLEVDGLRASRIRVPHPTTVVKPDGGTKKRRREAISNYVWTVGDRVDAWMRDGWWEGIVTDKSKEDETKLSVHFPAGGDTSVVRAWNLRPSLIWKDGQWIQWSRHKENTLEPYEGDTPHEKRPKVSRFRANGDSDADGQGNGRPSRNLPEESRPLILSAKERIFSVGKTVREGSNSGALKSMRTVPQKEGSRVVFGVPKPGKKRKFMEVSKHYVADKTDKISEGNNSIKFAKYLMPQASRSLRNTSKVDPGGKRAAGAKPKWPRPIKSQITQTRSTAEKDNSSVSNASASSCAESGHGAFSNPRASTNDEESQLERQNILEVGSTKTLGMPDILVVEPSVQCVPDVPPAKVIPTSAVDADLGVKQKITPAVQKSITNEEKGMEHPGRAMPEANELRRSNRRIQPTSRLLEGLQSSLIISKAPTVSHDRGSRALHRGGPPSKGNTHG
ncbi:hypothetical protein J5N97_018493 [Dioscorea zingiberensis]|uniref:Agenet domain-containing protein n=1 Tax=Dioscorea zingiberensis TaxID=325984 RepID=A0A9D5HBJ2_9LILI|nr:hypothetical protein J5N97_018493 [Dioscorea zingiberensis]